MRVARNQQSRGRGGAGLPLALLVLFLGAIGGLAIWAQFASPVDVAEHGPAPHVAELPWPPQQAADQDAAETPGPAAPGSAAPSDEKVEITGGTGDIVAPPPEKRAPPPSAAKEPEPPSGDEAAPPAQAKPRIAIERTPESLAPAPDPDLIQQSPLGPLPIVSQDGRKAWQVYARPFDRADKRPKIAIVLSQLGLSGPPTEAAIQRLPGAVTLSFASYAENLEEWIRLARTAGHEVLLDVPMEPANYPDFDPGPQALFTSLSTTENLNRLYWTLGRATGYVGVADFMGSQFTTSRSHMVPVLDVLKKRGILFLDTRRAPRSVIPEVASEVGVVWASNTRFIDEHASRRSIDAQLTELERAAKENGQAIGVGLHYPVTIERVAAWTKSLGEKGLVLAPVSALAYRGTEG